MQSAYSTQDFYLASYLFTTGNRIKDTRLVNNNTTEFEFENNTQLQKAIDNFYAMRTLVEPLAYGAAIRSIKSMIHALKNASNTSSKQRGTNNVFKQQYRRQISRG